MVKDKFKSLIAEITEKAFRQAFPELPVSDTGLFISDVGQVYSRLEVPKNQEWGNYALPLFELSGALRMNPVEINTKLTKAQNEIAESDQRYSCLRFTAVSGFNNTRIRTETLAEAILPVIWEKGEEFAASDEGKGGVIVIDYSSPNIARPFGVAHLRTTAIGNALYRIYLKLGYRPVGINHLGDWGTQFGKLIVAYRKWGNEEDLKKDPIMRLLDLYVQFHKEEELDPSLTDQARKAFKELESGRLAEVELWSKFRDYSLQAFNKTYDRLGIHFDYYTGESFYNDKIGATIERLERAGLVKISQQALIVDLAAYDLPPAILRKADGATLYATRDIAGILYRWKTFEFDKALYVVGASQKDHFSQVFKVIELLEEAEKVPFEKRCSHRLVHVDFGWIRFRDEAMSTRKGNIVFLDDVLDRATSLAREKILEKNPDLVELEKTAHQIGIGAVLFADMSTRRQKDVNFDWDEVLNFEGETGPYLQYTHARLSSLLRHYKKTPPRFVNYSLLDRPEEYRILDLLYKFPEAVSEAAECYEPYIIAAHLIELASAFNRMYQRKDDQGRIDKIISDDRSLTDARVALVSAVKNVIKNGLELLGIEAPEEM